MVGAIIGQCEGRVAMFEASAGQQDEEDEGNTTSSLVHIGGGAKRNGIQSNHGIGGRRIAMRCISTFTGTRKSVVGGWLPPLESRRRRFAAEGVA